MTPRHTAEEFSEHEWTAFWRENNERQIMNYTSIFKGTLRRTEYRDYGSFVVTSLGSRFIDLAPIGTFKVRVMDSTVPNHTSHEPPPVALARGWLPENAMLQALTLYAPDWSKDVGSP